MAGNLTHLLTYMTRKPALKHGPDTVTVGNFSSVRETKSFYHCSAKCCFVTCS